MAIRLADMKRKEEGEKMLGYELTSRVFSWITRGANLTIRLTQALSLSHTCIHSLTHTCIHSLTQRSKTGRESWRGRRQSRRQS